MTKLDLAQECNIKVKEKKHIIISLDSVDKRAPDKIQQSF